MSGGLPGGASALLAFGLAAALIAQVAAVTFVLVGLHERSVRLAATLERVSRLERRLVALGAWRLELERRVDDLEYRARARPAPAPPRPGVRAVPPAPAPLAVVEAAAPPSPTAPGELPRWQD